MMIKLVAKWNGKNLPLELPEDATVGSVRQVLANLTEVQPKRQKLIGLGKKPNPEDDLSLASLNLKKEHSFMMVGCKESSVLTEPPTAELPAVVNDLDWDYQPEEYKNIKISPEYRANVEEKLSKIKIHLINEPRKGKKLLVLDLDYTLLDSSDIRNAPERISELKRPYCDEFLERLYPHYDIVVWSQTSWRWLEMKLTEMGMLHVKPLEFIWRRFPDFYDRRNTVHVDDLSRNFVLNPANGLKCTAFKEALRRRGDDRELYHIGLYLEHIAGNVEDLSTLRHGEWADYVRRNGLL